MSESITVLLRSALSEALDAGLSVRLVARETGLNHAALAKFLRGEQSLRLDKADALAEYFGITCQQTERRTEMPLDRQTWQAAVAEYWKWQLSDEVLYKLCRKWPRHSDLRKVYAKVNIIGRAFGTGIERQVDTGGARGTARDRVADALHDNRTAVDRLVRRLQHITEPLSVESLRKCVAAHGQFVAILQNVTRRGQTPRTFAAKYLHCHAPVVPIFDSMSRDALKPLVPLGPALRVFEPMSEEVDDEYYLHVLRFWNVYQQAQEMGFNPTARHLDFYLWSACQREEGE